MKKLFTTKPVKANIPITVISAGYVDTKQLILIPVEQIGFYGEKLSEKQALKIVNKTFNDKKQYIIIQLEYFKWSYEIDFNLFMQYAKEVKKPVIYSA